MSFTFFTLEYKNKKKEVSIVKSKNMPKEVLGTGPKTYKKVSNNRKRFMYFNC